MPNSRAFLTAILLSTICCTAPLHAQSESPDKPKRKIVTAPALQQAPVDFNHPPREYVSREAQGWDVFIEKELADQEPERAKAALGRLDAKLGEIVKVLPESALPDLRKVKIFIMHGQHAKNGGRSSGLEYFRQESPKHYEWLDPRMASSIVIYDAENYLRLTDHWALKALMHEIFMTLGKRRSTAGSIKPFAKRTKTPSTRTTRRRITSSTSPNSPRPISPATTISLATAPP
jgi:hypothetical protein